MKGNTKSVTNENTYSQDKECRGLNFGGVTIVEFVIITGMSGAGKSQAMKAMEDIGYYCMDNLPPALLSKFAELCYQSKRTIDKVAVVVDIRGGIFFEDLF